MHRAHERGFCPAFVRPCPCHPPLPCSRAGRRGVTIFMPAYLEQSGDLGAKIVSVFPRNLTAGLPSIHAAGIVIDSTTGRPSALMDGTYLTALRTGAASGAATDLLARRDARVVGIFGAGAQGRTQLEAVCTVRLITEPFIFDKDRKQGERYSEEMRDRGDRSGGNPCGVLPSRGPSPGGHPLTAATSTQPVFEGKI